jgi:hypothetical protein
MDMPVATKSAQPRKKASWVFSISSLSSSEKETGRATTQPTQSRTKAMEATTGETTAVMAWA